MCCISFLSEMQHIRLKPFFSLLLLNLAPLKQVAGGVHCTMACMSRAGREPGFKKQNQDNCFAFEKYVVGDQSLFGAFDGHGPNGA